MAEKLLRVRLDLSDVCSDPYCHVWFSLVSSALYTIRAFKLKLCETFNIHTENKIQLYMEDFLICDDETTLLFRDNDVIKVTASCHSKSSLENAKNKNFTFNLNKSSISKKCKRSHEAESCSLSNTCSGKKQTSAFHSLCCNSSDNAIVTVEKHDDTLNETVMPQYICNSNRLFTVGKKLNAKKSFHICSENNERKRNRHIEGLNEDAESFLNLCDDGTNQLKIKKKKIKEPRLSDNKKEIIRKKVNKEQAIDSLKSDKFCPSSFFPEVNSYFNHADNTDCVKKKKKKSSVKEEEIISTFPHCLVEEASNIHTNEDSVKCHRETVVGLEKQQQNSPSKHTFKQIMLKSTRSVSENSNENIQMLMPEYNKCHQDNDSNLLSKISCSETSQDNVHDVVISDVSVINSRLGNKPDLSVTNNCHKRKRRRRRKRKSAFEKDLTTNDSLLQTSNSSFVNNDKNKNFTSELLNNINTDFHSIPKHIRFSESSENVDLEQHIENITNTNAAIDLELNNGNINSQNLENHNFVSQDSNYLFKSALKNNASDLSPITCPAPESVLQKEELIPQITSIEPHVLIAQEDAKSKLQDDNYCQHPLLNSVPSVGTHITYKILELSELYCPEVSDYKEGIIKNIFGDELEIELISEEIKTSRTGKFENVYPDENPSAEVLKTVIVRWSELIEPRQILKNLKM